MNHEKNQIFPPKKSFDSEITSDNTSWNFDLSLSMPNKHDTFARLFFSDLFSKFSLQITELRNRKILWILVTHLICDMPFLINAIEQIGLLGAIIPKGSEFLHEIPDMQDFYNKVKERYKDLLCFDVTRDKLKDFQFAKEFIETKCKKFDRKEVIIIDEGGYFSEFVKALANVSSEENTEEKYVRVIIEWTGNGHIRYQNLFSDQKFITNNKIMLGSIAISNLKKLVDHTEIGSAIIAAIEQILRTDAGTDLRDMSIGLIGCGVVGGSILHALAEKKFASIILYDQNPEATKRLFASLVGIPSNKIIIANQDIEVLSKADLIISATGNYGIHSKNIKFLKQPCYLACATSADDEISPEILREYSVIDIKNSGRYIKKHLSDTNRNEAIYLMLNGRGVNFLSNSIVSPSIFAVSASALVLAIRLLTAESNYCALNTLNLFTNKKDIQEIETAYHKFFPSLYTKVKTFNFTEAAANYHKKKFIGRVRDLEEIKKAFSQDNEFGVLGYVISGLGGIGKSCLARAYAFNAIKGFTYHYIIWINATNLNTLTKDFFMLAEELKINTINILDPNQLLLVIKNIYEILFNNYRKVLIIFDNACSYSHLARAQANEPINFLPPAKMTQNQYGTIHWLATTRNQNFADDLSIQKNLSGFDLPEAIEYIKHFPKSPSTEEITDEDAKNLATTLAFFPLAISTATTYITCTPISIKNYLELYKKYSLEILKKPLAQNDPYWDTPINLEKINKNEQNKLEEFHQHSLYTVLKISLLNLEDKNPLAIDILNYCSYFCSTIIPKELVKQFFLNENLIENDFENALMELTDQSLIIYDQKQYIHIHELLQTVIELDHNESKHLSIISELILKIHSQLPNYLDIKTLDRSTLIFNSFNKLNCFFENEIFISKFSHEVLLQLWRNYNSAGCFILRLSLDTTSAQRYFDKANAILKIYEQHANNIEIIREMQAIENNQIVLTAIRSSTAELKDMQLIQEVYSYWKERFTQNESDANLHKLILTTSNYFFLLSILSARQKLSEELKIEQLEVMQKIFEEVDALFKIKTENITISSELAYRFGQFYSSVSSMHLSFKNYEETITNGEKSCEIFSNQKFFEKPHTSSMYILNKIAIAYLYKNQLVNAKAKILRVLDISIDSQLINKDPTVVQETLKSYAFLIGLSYIEKETLEKLKWLKKLNDTCSEHKFPENNMMIIRKNITTLFMNYQNNSIEFQSIYDALFSEESLTQEAVASNNLNSLKLNS